MMTKHLHAGQHLQTQLLGGKQHHCAAGPEARLISQRAHLE